jgi:hypothetical protein
VLAVGAATGLAPLGTDGPESGGRAEFALDRAQARAAFPPLAPRGPDELRPALLSAAERLGAGIVKPRGTRATAEYSPLAADPKEYHQFYFTRAIWPDPYGQRSFGRGGFGNRGRCGNHRWCTDWPEADIHLSSVIGDVLDVDIYVGENSVELDDPDLRRFPFLYLVEPGFMTLTESQRQGLRSYLLQGGFLVLDDFWGSAQYGNFAYEFSLIFPEFPIVEIPLEHPIFKTVYEIDEIVQVPYVGRGRSGGPTWEEDGYEPWVHGIFDDKGRLMVLVNAHTDLGDGMEWADDPYYPTRYSTYAFFMEMNMIVYALAN